MKKEVWIKLVKRIGNWIVNICFYSCVAFVAWMVLQVFCLTSFKIPSNSMEPALLSGDKILVDKWTGGARLFNIFASLRGEEVDIYRVSDRFSGTMCLFLISLIRMGATASDLI